MTKANGVSIAFMYMQLLFSLFTDLKPMSATGDLANYQTEVKHYAAALHVHSCLSHNIAVPVAVCADILRVMPSKAIELTAFDAYKKLLSHEDGDRKLKRPGPLLTGLAGAAAGSSATCFKMLATTPTAMALHHGMS